MRSSKYLVLLFALLAGCGGGGGDDDNGGGTPPPDPTATVNEMTVTVNGSLADPNTSQGYLNKPAVSVTLCTPDNSACQTINDILLDTGSYGLRIFGSAITVPLTQSTIGGRALAECVGFADGTTSWGPVRIANVVLGAEPAVQVPIQVIDATFGNSSVCGTPDASPVQAGFTGILGVGIFAQDCGAGCANSAANGMYFSCAGTSCTGVAAPLANQVTNPVTALPQDNNGVVVQLPAVPATGAPSVNGKVLLGIGTRTNNTPSGVTTFDVSTAGNFPTFFTTINGTTYSSFLDTGSNGIFLPTGGAPFFQPGGANIPVCSNGTWFCPPSTVTLTGTNTSASGAVSAPVSFDIANFNTLTNTGNQVFNNLGGPSFGPEIDFGLPFFLGRTIFIGYQGRTSPLGTGPYWAF